MTVEARPPVFILFISLRSLSSSKRKRLESSCFSCLELETNPAVNWNGRAAIVSQSRRKIVTVHLHRLEEAFWRIFTSPVFRNR